MSGRSLILTCWAAAQLLLLGGCSMEPPRVEQPAMNPDRIAADALSQYDANKDGKIADAELEKCPSLKSSLARLDTNKDGGLQAEEIADRIRAYQKRRTGVYQVIGHLTLDGKPLDGATVTVTPEKFMGSTVEPAVATSANGMIRPAISGLDVHGLRCGFYRITVSLKNAGGQETIPGEFTTPESVLGVEMGPGAPAVEASWEVKVTSREKAAK